MHVCSAIASTNNSLQFVVADVISTKMITVSPTSTNVITLTPDSKHKSTYIASNWFL